uniref:Uncharacterized protein n=1 Tax=viral metagenome TaxID=1070528 RepID=A0A6M3JEH3_9ZZZZ
MSTWLKLLTMELDSIAKADFMEPPEALSPNDNVIGDMDDSDKRLFTLSRLLIRDAQQNKLDSNFCPDKGRREELENKAMNYGAKAQVVKELLWIGLRDRFGLWNGTIGIRAGFKVVTIHNDNTDDDISPFLRHLLGDD